MAGSDAGDVAARRVSSYMLPREAPHWAFASWPHWAADCVQKLAIIIDDQGVAAAPETAAVGTACVRLVRLARWARGHLPAAVTRKGYP